MKFHAYIFSSASDLPLAGKAAAWMRAHGWLTTISQDVVAPRLMGKAAALEIAEIMADSDADIVAKIDADTRLTETGIKWLEGCRDKARGFQICKSAWCGISGCRIDVIRKALPLIRKAQNCQCPESGFFAGAYREAAGKETHPLPLFSWITGRPVPRETCGLTLPTRYRGDERTAHGNALFALNFAS